ncbi:MAG: hypothetical protein IJS79_00865 [Oscillospiraceae bacterium]|nr:hypothetical protein [Oscillospiraceae bacterium]
MAFLHILGIILKILGFSLLGVLGLVLVLLLVLLLIPIGADVEYIGGNTKVSAKVCGILIQLIPRKKKDKDKPPKEKKEKKKKEKKPKPEKETGEDKPKEKKKLDFTVEEIFEVVKKVLGSLKKFGKLTVDRFLLHYTAAGKDPYTTARTFGAVNASLCALEPICSRQFRVKDYDVWTDCDFTADKMNVDVAVCITLRLWQFVHVGLAAAFGVLGVLIRHKRRIRREKRAAKRSAANGGIKTEENNETIKGTEERNDKNG